MTRRFLPGWSDFLGPKGWAMRLRRRSAALRAEPLRVSSLRAAAAIAEPFGVLAFFAAVVLVAVLA